MKTFKLSDAGDRGWYVGQFDRAVHKTDLFEAGYQTFKKGQYSPKHFHAVATEINLVINGKVMYGNNMLGPGDGIIYEPGEVCECYYLEDTTTVVIKTPGVLGDKYLVEDIDDGHSVDDEANPECSPSDGSRAES